MPALLLAPVIAAAVLGAAAVVLALQRRSQRRLIGRAAPYASGTAPTVLSFTGESCTICHVAQRPALARLCEQLPDLDVREVDVAREPETARAFRVMTLPTTVVLDVRGQIVAVNAGFASDTVLRRQVEQARAGSEQLAVACG